MPSLREKMAEYGFESNDDYEFQVRCLLESPNRGLRALNIEGDSERRKTAFANALARALDYPHCLYHDFTEQHPPPPDLILPPSRDELGRAEPPIQPLDQTPSEACAQSEGEPTILILDQLQAADFREHIRVHRLIADCAWEVRGGHYYANPRHLLIFLISVVPLTMPSRRRASGFGSVAAPSARSTIGRRILGSGRRWSPCSGPWAPCSGPSALPRPEPPPHPP